MMSKKKKWRGDPIPNNNNKKRLKKHSLDLGIFGVVGWWLPPTFYFYFFYYLFIYYEGRSWNRKLIIKK